MEDDLPVETMSVELAIQRELAYRRKLASELGPNDDSLKNLIPLEAQFSIPSPIGNGTSSLATKRKEPSTNRVSVPQPLAPVVQSSIQYPITNHLSSFSSKRKEPSTSVNEPWPLIQPATRNPFPSGPTSINNAPVLVPENKMMIVTDNLRCKLCGVDCLSQFNLEQHVSGQKHQTKLQEFAKGQRWWCQVCCVACSDENALQMHVQGKKHKSKVLELDHPRFYCQVCRIWCIDESSYRQHLDGKKHNGQIRLSK